MPDDEPSEIAEAISISHNLPARKLRKEVEKFIQNLDFVTIAELSIIYYSDCLTGVFLFRSLLQVVALSPRPSGVPELVPAKAHLSLILTSTVLSIFIHLARDSPQAGEVSRGYLLGGLLVDFIGELGPISKFKLILLDLLVGYLQLLAFTTNIKKAKIKDPSDSTTTTSTTQDHDAEEAGLRRSAEGRENAGDEPPQEGVELQSLLSQEENAYMPVANLNIHPLDEMYTGDFVLLKIDLWNDIKNYLVLETASPSLPSVDSARATRLVRSLIFGRPGA